MSQRLGIRPGVLTEVARMLARAHLKGLHYGNSPPGPGTHPRGRNR